MRENPCTGSPPVHCPSSLATRLCQRARTRPARVVLPDGGDPRVVQAAAAAHREGIAQVVLLGAPVAIEAAARAAGANLEGVPCPDPAADPRLDKLAARYCDARPSDSAGLVAGACACATIGATIEPALRVRRLTPGPGPAHELLPQVDPARAPRGRAGRRPRLRRLRAEPRSVAEDAGADRDRRRTRRASSARWSRWSPSSPPPRTAAPRTSACWRSGRPSRR